MIDWFYLMSSLIEMILDHNKMTLSQNDNEIYII
jgi:hypothetical protein